MTDPTQHMSGGDAGADLPRWRHEPYLLLFPLGVALTWAAVGHWLLHATGYLEDYRPVFHAMAQIEGFLTCFAVGFLLTMIPRRTDTGPAATWQIAVGLAAPVLTTVAGWYEHWLLSQVSWLVLAVMIISFVVNRFRSSVAGRRPPNCFLWIPVALLMGMAGALMTGSYALLEEGYFWIHNLGRGLLLQGMFISLVLGVGGLAIPLMTRGQPPPDTTPTMRDRMALAAHALCAAILAASFWIEVTSSLPLGMLIRAGVVLAVLLGSVQLWRLPTTPGWTRRLIWLSAWMLPAGYLMAAVFPEQFKAGLHVTFLGGFALLALAVSTQVTLGHGGYAAMLQGRPWQVGVIGFFTVLTMVPRALMEFDRARFFEWMAVAAVLFLAATITWAAFLIPKMLAPIPDED